MLAEFKKQDWSVDIEILEETVAALLEIGRLLERKLATATHGAESGLEALSAQKSDLLHVGMSQHQHIEALRIENGELSDECDALRERIEELKGFESSHAEVEAFLGEVQGENRELHKKLRDAKREAVLRWLDRGEKSSGDFGTPFQMLRLFRELLGIFGDEVRASCWEGLECGMGTHTPDKCSESGGCTSKKDLELQGRLLYDLRARNKELERGLAKTQKDRDWLKERFVGLVRWTELLAEMLVSIPTDVPETVLPFLKEHHQEIGCLVLNANMRVRELKDEFERRGLSN